MIFHAPSWVPELPVEIPTESTVGDFVLQGTGSNRLQVEEEQVLTDALTGKTYSIQGLRERVEHLARGLADDLGWSPSRGEAADKVVAIYSFNTIDYIVLCWAIHRLNGTVLTLYTSSSEETLQKHMQASACKAVFTCQSLVGTCEKLIQAVGIPPTYMYMMNVSDEHSDAKASKWQSLDNLVKAGSHGGSLELLQWKAGQGSEQIAFLTATSGTSGKQRLARITHKNIITNILQATSFESYVKKGKSEVSAMVLPFSHAYTLAVSQMMIWRADRVILHPRFHVMKMLESIKTFRIERLYLVPAIISALAKNPFLLEMHDCSSVHSIVSGAGPLSKEVSALLTKVRPNWNVLPAYGLTETAIVVSLTSPHDIFHGSSGSLLPRIEMRLVDAEGRDADGFEQRGEVLVRGPSNISGYLNEEDATQTLIDADGWLHTGDVGLVRIHDETQTEHLFIVDRMKDMIKVNGLQVAPKDIEAQLVDHSAVQDAAVIGVPDEVAGERPQAYIVLSPKYKDMGEKELRLSINEHIEVALTNTHWLGTRIVFIDEIPRNQSGKILKEVLRARARGE